MEHSWLEWGSFIALVLAILAADLGLFAKRADQTPTIKSSLKASAVYITMALMFAGWVYIEHGNDRGNEFLTAYVVEKTLSLDNVFVISLIFSAFAIPVRYQHRVLFWGVLGVLAMRGAMIGVGAAAVARFGWVEHLFALFLVFTGIKMLFSGDKPPADIKEGKIFKFVQRFFPMTDKLHGQNFFVRQNNQLLATPLFITLLMVEFVDLIFAIDSVPAVLAITKDTYVVYTSNIFAILGLRSLYFALAGVVHRFYALGTSLALLLVFIGSKGVIAHLMGWEKFPASISLGVTFAMITGGVVASLVWPKDEHKAV